jgi:hypothetical protein
MDALARTIDAAVAKNDYASLISVFSDSNGPAAWHSVGQGEQRSVAAHFITVAIASPSFFPKAFDSSDMVQVVITALGHLPSTVPNAADNALRHMLFDYKVKHEGDYAEAARILGGTRMEDDTASVYYTSPAAKCDGVYIILQSCHGERIECLSTHSRTFCFSLTAVYVKIAECFLAVSYCTVVIKDRFS